MPGFLGRGFNSPASTIAIAEPLHPKRANPAVISYAAERGGSGVPGLCLVLPSIVPRPRLPRCHFS